MSDFPGFQLRVNLTLSGTIDIVPLSKLPAPEVITSIKADQMKGLVTLASITDTTVTSRPVAVTFDVGASVTVDMIDPAATFPIPSGATLGTATPTGSVNPVGTGASGTPFQFSIPSAPPPPTLPVAEVITGVQVLSD